MLLQPSRTPVITAQHGSNHKIKRNIKTNKRHFLHRNQVSKQRGDICRKCSERHHLKETIHGLDVQLFQTSEKVSDTSAFPFLHLFSLILLFICICTKKAPTQTGWEVWPWKLMYKDSLNQKVFTSDFSERREGVYILFVLEIMYERCGWLDTPNIKYSLSLLKQRKVIPAVWKSFKVLSHKHANSCRHTEKQSLLLQLLKDQRLTPDMSSSWLHVMLSWRL